MNAEEITPQEMQSASPEDQVASPHDDAPGITNDTHVNDPGDSNPGETNASQAQPGSSAGVTLAPTQQRERAAQLAELTDPGSALYRVYLGHYFGIGPNIIACRPDQFESRFLMDRYQDALHREQTGQPMTPYQSRIIGQPAQGNEAAASPSAQQGSAPAPASAAKGAAAAMTDPAQNQGVVLPLDPGQYAAAGAPVAASTMAEQRAQNSDSALQDKSPPALTIDEFNQFATIARAQESRIKQAGGETQVAANSPGQKQVLEMQQRLGVKQTGRYDNATRRALQSAFIDMLRPYAVEAESKYGIPAPVTIAQAIIESGYGIHIPTDVTSGQRSNNFFGIKPDQDGQPFVTSRTKEYNKTTGNMEIELQPFAVYDDFGGSVEEHSAFLKRNSIYKSLFSTSDPEEWADGLQNAGYAGDSPDYASALKNTMRMWKLIK